MRSAITLLSLPLALLPVVSAHCKITAATGSSGGSTSGLGITAGSGNSESDVTIFQKTPQAAGFGSLASGGAVNPVTAMPAALKIASSNVLPQVAPGGNLNINMHVVNADGAGPMACYVSSDATGNSWQQMTVSQNVPGNNGVGTANNQDFPMVVQMPQGVSCTGKVNERTALCMVKCQNPVGPFGGTVAVHMVGGAPAGGQQAPPAPATNKAATPAPNANAKPAAPQGQSQANFYKEIFGSMRRSQGNGETENAGKPAAVRSILEKI